MDRDRNPFIEIRHIVVVKKDARLPKNFMTTIDFLHAIIGKPRSG